MKTNTFLKIANAVLLIALQATTATVDAQNDPLNQWNEGPAKAAIISFVEAVTDQTNPAFLPVEYRVAVLDMDGTVLIEKPNFVLFDFINKLMLEQIAGNPGLKKKQPYKAYHEQDWAYFEALDLDGLYGILLDATAGYKEDEYRQAVLKYFNTVIDKRYKMPYDQLVYVPVTQLIDYLQYNQFEVYIVSGSDPQFTRAISEKAMNIPEQNVIGTTVLTKWVETDTGSYFIRERRFVEPINDVAGKPVNILNKIGKIPVVAVGNSAGDYHMLELSKSAPVSLQMIINHDDSVREYYYDTKKMKALCKDNQWLEVSMKNDFKMIFNLKQEQEMKNLQTASYKMTTPIPEGIEMPDEVNSRLGKLNFFDGFPDDATVEKLYDNLDFQRAVQAYLLAIPSVSMLGMRNGLTGFGPPNTTILTWETLYDSRALCLTANCNSPYTTTWIDLQQGPLVIEVPPKVLGMVNDVWSRYVADVGVLGEDKGAGGKYLLLPPGYKGAIPEGYFVIPSSTYECFYFFRHFAVNGDFKPAIESLKKYSKIYPLSQAENPPQNNFINISGKEFCGISPADNRFWELLHEVVQKEPSESFDRVSLGYFASIGIEKGKPFKPDARMKKILSEAVVVGDATARTIAYKIRQKENFLYENSSWRGLFLGGYKFDASPNVMSLDGSVNFYFSIMGVSPAEDLKIIGKGSQYAVAYTDVDGNPLNGAKNYTMLIPPDVPVKDFWSIIIYDYQTRSLLQTDQQFPMVTSQNKELIINPDKSVNVYFGPKPPAGKENNWIQTIPGKGWFTMLRLYGPLEPWFDKTWKPGEIILVEEGFTVR